MCMSVRAHECVCLCWMGDILDRLIGRPVNYWQYETFLVICLFVNFCQMMVEAATLQIELTT